jgi:hypothetical protein
MARKTGSGKKGVKTSNAKKARTPGEKASASKPKGRATTAGGAAANALPPAPPKSEAALRSFIKKLKAPTMHDDDLAAVLSHFNSVRDVRKAAAAPTAASTRSMSGKCYMKSGEDTTVSIYEGPYHVGSMSEANAIALGIPSCG